MKNDIHSLSGAYVLDAIEPEERTRFEHHLSTCAACRADVAAFSAMLVDLSESDAEEPPASLRRSVLTAIDDVSPLPPSEAEPITSAPARPITAHRRLGRHRPLLAAAALLVVAAVAAIAIAVGTMNSPSGRSGVDAVLEADDAHRVEQVVDGFTAAVVTSRARNEAVLVSDDMPPPPAGRSYQLWYQRPDIGMQSAGIMPRSADGQKVLLEGALDDATAVGVTLEPEGGSPDPTSEPIVVFTLG